MSKKLCQAVRRMESAITSDRDQFYWPDDPYGDDFDEDDFDDDVPIYYGFLRATEYNIWQDDLAETITDTLRHVNMKGDLQLSRARLVEIAATATRFAELMMIADCHESLAAGRWPRRRGRKLKARVR